MPVQTRRGFFKSSAACFLSSSALLSAPSLFASPFGLPIGLQLYSVREMLPQDFAGTLKKVGELGYREVEAAGFFNHPAAEVKRAMSDAGLKCVSGHYAYDTLNPNLGKIIDFHKELGAEYIICSSPGHKEPSATKGHGLSLDDWRWNAEQFNRLGKTVKEAGLRFGYHNHTAEFRADGGVIPFDELLRLTDAALVTFEMDCGWVTVGGGDPAEYLRKFPTRISMLHVKDFKHSDQQASSSNPPAAAELGRGTVDFKAIFAAAKKSQIRHYFVEQEAFDMPPFEALKIDADYMKRLTA